MNRKIIVPLFLVSLLAVALWFQFSTNPKHLTASLVSTNDDERHAALFQLQKLSDKNRRSVVTMLIPGLTDAQPQTRLYSLYAIRTAKGSDENIVPNLVPLLNDPDEAVKKEAVISLVDMGVAALPALIHAWETTSPELATAISNAIVRLGSPAISPLMEALKHPHRLVRANAIATLGKITPPTNEIISVLRPFLKDMDKLLRSKAAVALNTLDPAISETIPMHIETLKEKRWDHDTYYALRALGVLGLKASVALPILKQRFQASPDSLVGDSQRMQILSAIENIDPRPRDLNALVWDLKNSDAVIRLRAASVFSSSAPLARAAAQPLIDVLSDSNIAVSRRAMFALSVMGFDHYERFKSTLIPKAAKSLSTYSPPVTEGYIEAISSELARVAPDVASAALMPLLNGIDSPYKKEAVSALEKIQKQIGSPSTPDEDSEHELPPTEAP